jgi:hypothetical protein
MLLQVMSLASISPVSIQAQPDEPLPSAQEKLSANIAFFFLDAFEYTFDVDGKQIFLNDTIKHQIITEYKPSVYNIPTLHYRIMDHIVNASGIEIHVNPTRIDEANTRLNFQIYANNADVTGQFLKKSYDNLEITSAYGIYDRISDKMTIHIPYSVALQHFME